MLLDHSTGIRMRVVFVHEVDCKNAHGTAIQLLQKCIKPHAGFVVGRGGSGGRRVRLQPQAGLGPEAEKVHRDRHEENQAAILRKNAPTPASRWGIR